MRTGELHTMSRNQTNLRSDDTLAERLRRRPAKPMGSPRVGSNPTGVVSISRGAFSAHDKMLLVAWRGLSKFISFREFGRE